MKNKIYSGMDKILGGTAPPTVVEGCMVLEGGAFRGVYTQGVLDYLMQNGINMRCSVGVSAGAVNAVNYVSGQIGRSARITLGHRHNDDYVGIGAIRKNDGIIGFDFLYNGFEKTDPLDRKRLFDSSRRLVAVATNLITGKTEYFDRDSCSDILQAIRASASMPFVSKPVIVDDAPYLDGGCSCKTPYNWAINEGYEKIIVIKTKEESYRKDELKLESKKMCDAVYRNYPKFASALKKSNSVYNDECDELDKLKKDGRIFMITPSKPVKVGRLESDMEKLGELYLLGVKDAKNYFSDLLKYLEL